MKILLTGWAYNSYAEEVELFFDSGRREVFDQDSILGIKKLWLVINKLLDIQEIQSTKLPLRTALDTAVDQQISVEDLDKILQ